MSTSTETPTPLHFETDRLILRPLSPLDSHDLFEYAQDPEIGPNSGWPSHKSHEETVDVLNRFLLKPNETSRTQEQPYINPYISSSTAPTFAVILKESGKMIGTVGIKDKFSVSKVDLVEAISKHPDFYTLGYQSIDELKIALFKDFDITKVVDNLKKIYYKELGLEEPEEVKDVEEKDVKEHAKLCNALEIGYALNRSYWGQGIIPEAAKGLLEQYIWPYFTPQLVLVTTLTSNVKSRRVVEKLGGQPVLFYPQSLFRWFDETTHDGEVFSMLPTPQ